MNMIVAVDENWGIGCKGKLLVSIPNDHKMFREMTTGKVIVYGRKTLDTFPQGQPLPGRTNLVLSANPSFARKGAQVFQSESELFAALKEYDDADIFIVGGESVYRLMLPYCDTVHVTKIDHAYAADAFFPNLDELKEWEITADSEEQTYFDIPYTFLRYERKKESSMMEE